MTITSATKIAGSFISAAMVLITVGCTSPQNNAKTSTPNLVRNTGLPSIFIAGDSTAAKGAGEQQQGWGVPFAAYFDPAKVNIINGARGGRSSRTFITEGLWSNLLGNVKAGDIVLIQFGHNDAGAINDTSRARGSLPGIGDETEEIDNLLTKKHEVVHTYGWYLRRMIAETKAKKATPILLTLTARNIWHDGRIERGSGRFSPWATDVARAEHVLFVDLTDLMADRFEAMGEDKVKVLYPRDHTHFDAVGADMHAAEVVALLKGLRPSPIGKFLSAKGDAMPADSASWLQLPIPDNPRLPTLFLIGDSTVRNGRGNGAGGQWGWGGFLAPCFDAQKINVVNRAVGGTSSRSFLNEGYWDRVRSMLRPGDFVMMQFGHNDNAPLNDKMRARGTIKGIGDESQTITNLLTGQSEVVHTFGWYLRKYAADTRAKGATPIICSQIPRKIWKGGKIVRSRDSYAGWAQQVAKAENVPFVDLNELIAEQYDELGTKKVDTLFADPHTHTTADGAKLNAKCVVTGLNALPDDPLAPFLSETKP